MESPDLWEASLRMITAVVVGASVGINRELHNRPAGLRTHALVALGASVSVIAGATLSATAEHRADVVSRIVQGIVTGVGFLGAGVILRDPSGRVQGLTTAAAIWVTALFGVACGVGAYREVLIALALVFAVLIAGGPIERVFERYARRSPGDNERGGVSGP